MKKTGIGIVGCGNISGVYFENLCTVFQNVEVIACADLEPERVQAKLAEYPEVKAATVEEILANPEIDIVVNLTTPQGHFSVAMQAVEAGKHVHNEKPVVLTRDEGKQLLAAAGAKGVCIGSAPDTFTERNAGLSAKNSKKLRAVPAESEGWPGETETRASTVNMRHGCALTSGVGT